MADFNFDSEVFNMAKADLNQQIRNVVEQLETGVFSKGKVSLTLDIELCRSKASDVYKQPVVSYKANHTLKHESKRKGIAVSESVIKKDEESGRYIEIPIEDPQLSLLEDE